jgi:hypothetical protein
MIDSLFRDAMVQRYPRFIMTTFWVCDADSCGGVFGTREFNDGRPNHLSLDRSVLGLHCDLFSDPKDHIVYTPLSTLSIQDVQAIQKQGDERCTTIIHYPIA